MEIYFVDIRLIDSNNDTIAVEETNNSENLFEHQSASNLKSVKFSKQNTNPVKIIGELDVKIANFYDKKYAIDNLPAGITMDPDGVSLIVDNSKFESSDQLVGIYAFAKDSDLNPLAVIVPKDYDYSTSIFVSKYVEQPTVIVLRYQDAYFKQIIPFELNVKKGPN